MRMMPCAAPSAMCRCGVRRRCQAFSFRPLQVVIQFLVRAPPKSRGGRAGLVIMSLFHLVNMTTKILVAEQSYTHLVTKESQILCKISLKTRIQQQ